jgi:hypothetical protein
MPWTHKPERRAKTRRVLALATAMVGISAALIGCQTSLYLDEGTIPMNATTSLDLPRRTGARPQTGPSVPHLQHTQTSPDEVRKSLIAWANATLPSVTETHSRISVPSSRAFWLSERVKVKHGDAFMPPPGSREFAHVHHDGSMHLCMSAEAREEVLGKDWGELHPYHARGVNEILFYAPRDEEELRLAKRALAESYKYATGRAVKVAEQYQPGLEAAR